MTRQHGPDWGRWRQWAEPDDPPRRLDFVIAGVTSGDHVNQMWEANRLPLADFRENGGVVGLYHFYEPVNALSQVKVFMKCVEEVQPQFVAVDFEKLYKEQVLGKTDVIITKQIIQELYKYFDHDKVMVYCGHDSWANLLMKYEPAFFGQCEFWLTWPNDAGENTVAFKPAYASLMGRAFDEVRIFQYSWEGDAEAYGILNGPTDIDLNVYVHKQPFDEWLGITDEPEEPEDPGEEPNEPPVDPGEGDDEMSLEDQAKRIADALEALVETGITINVTINGEVPPDNGGGNTGGGNEEPPAVEDSWPQYVRQMYGSWEAVKALVPEYVASNRAAVYQVGVEKAAVFEESSRNQQARSEEAGGGFATKILFDKHDDYSMDYDPGAFFPAYKDLLPNNVNEVPIGGIAAHSEKKIELIEYPGKVVRPKFATMIGYFGADGKYIKA